MVNSMKDDTATNVTLEQEENKKFFPCPICDEGLEVKDDKNEKPYCICNDCQVQLFVRGKIGIKRFKKLLSNLELTVDSGGRLIRLIDQSQQLKSKLVEVQFRKPLFGTNSDLEIQEKALQKQLSVLQADIQRYSTTKTK